MPERSPTMIYLKRRELVLGRRLTISRDPEVAAPQLVEGLGGPRLARRFVVDLLAAIDREHPAARRSA